MAMAAIIFFALLALVLAGACGILYTNLRHARQECRRQQTESEQQQERFAQERQQDRALMEQVRGQMPDTFKALAGDTLKASNEQFLQLAGERFSREQTEAAKQLEMRKQAVEALVKPLRERLEKHDTALQDVEKARREAYGSLKTQVGALIDDQRGLKKETANLVQALRRPDIRGRWGEIQLKRVAELAGMIDRCDFDEQVTVKSDAVSQSADMVVNLSNKRTIVVDAKTPLDAYISAIEAPDEEQRRTFLKVHTRQVTEKVDELSRRQYKEAFERSPDFVVLFIPGEPFLYGAVQCRPDLIDWAWQKGVAIATPNTLIALLRVIAIGWREEQLAASAREISELGRQLHKRVYDAVAHVGKLGGSLEAAVKAYNRFLGSLETRVIVSARRFEELGAGSGKALPEQIDPIEAIPREVKAATGNDDDGGDA